jgi:hypothetical protein
MSEQSKRRKLHAEADRVETGLVAEVAAGAALLQSLKFLSDVVAGVTVGLVALPLAMASAIASGCRRRRGCTVPSSPASWSRRWAAP